MWTIAEIANKIMKYSSPINRNQEGTFKVVELPEKFYEPQPSDFVNDKTYLTNEFLDSSFHSSYLLNVSSISLFFKAQFLKYSHKKVSRKRSSDEDCIQNGGSDRKKKKQFAV